MIDGGSAMVYVSDLERSVQFFGQTLGLEVVANAPGHFAMLRAQNGFLLGLHPAGPNSPMPGTAGAIRIGFSVAIPLEEVVDSLRTAGVTMADKIAVDGGNIRTIGFEDPDGNPMFLVEQN